MSSSPVISGLICTLYLTRRGIVKHILDRPHIGVGCAFYSDNYAKIQN